MMMIATWPDLKALALSLILPGVIIDHPRGTARLKAHGRMWCCWSPCVDATVFKAGRHAEPEMLLAADPDAFTLHPHDEPHNLILVRAGRIDEGWATARLIRQWRDAAPRNAGSRPVRMAVADDAPVLTLRFRAEPREWPTANHGSAGAGSTASPGRSMPTDR